MTEHAGNWQRWLIIPLSDRMKFAVKVALSMTLAIMIPMALGWPQPTTAATTVMIIAATGGMRESLMKGTLRLAGTVLGACLGLGLIAFFAQDRLYYLLSASLTVSLLLYLFSAFKGDGTIFMLAAVTTLLVFNGGEVENAFIYGIERTHLTIFGVAIYTLVGSFLWPDRTEQHLEDSARPLLALNTELFERFREGADSDGQTELLQRIAAAELALTSQYQAARSQDSSMAGYQAEWQELLHQHRALSRELSTALEPARRPPLDYTRYIPNYDGILSVLANRLENIARDWRDEATVADPEPVSVDWHKESLSGLGHFLKGRVAARVATLRELLRSTERLGEVVHCLQCQGAPLQIDEPASAAAVQFELRDPESIKLGVKVFITFWLSTGVWIAINPPGGFTFVTMSTVLLVLVSFSPLSAKMLYLLFGLGFAFILPCYVFLLPSLSRSYELALFLFAYSLFGHYVFKGPVALFFMLGLFTIGLDNTMNYNLGAQLNVMLMFCLIITSLVFTGYFIFNAKPEYLFNLMRRRFFRQTKQLLVLRTAPVNGKSRRLTRIYRSGIATTLAKMKLWGSKIDTTYFHTNSTEKLMSFASACELVNFRVNTLMDSAGGYQNMHLAESFKNQFKQGILLNGLTSLAGKSPSASTHRSIREALISAEAVEEKLSAMFRDIDTDQLTEEDFALFYTHLNQLGLLWHALDACEEAMQAVDWRGLAVSRF